MRGLAIFAVVLAGCVPRSLGPPDDPGGDPGGGYGSLRCHDDTACKPGQVCARTSACLPSDQVRAIHVTWTVSGKPADATTCSNAVDLEIQLESTTGVAHLAYVPVPCVEGKFSVDKAPISLDRVSLGRSYSGAPQTAKIDAITGEASLDLPY